MRQKNKRYVVFYFTEEANAYKMSWPDKDFVNTFWKKDTYNDTILNMIFEKKKNSCWRYLCGLRHWAIMLGQFYDINDAIESVAAAIKDGWDIGYCLIFDRKTRQTINSDQLEKNNRIYI